MEDYTTIRVLAKKGHSIKYIARTLGISRNTVKKYLRQQAPPKYQVKTVPENPCLDQLIEANKSLWQAHEATIVELYYGRRYRKSRVYKELKRQGAEGHRSGFYDYLRRLDERNAAARVRERFETLPGKQMQFDWAEYDVLLGSERRTVYVYLLILGHSRFKFALAGLDKSQPTILEVHQACFEFFGGVCEELLTDNAKQMVDQPARGAGTLWNKTYEDFLTHYGITPKACRVRHPWTKGKVENPFRYLEDHFIQGGVYRDLSDFNDQLSAFLSGWNALDHSGIGCKPSDRFETERPCLLPLPPRPFSLSSTGLRKVSSDCLISFEGRQYSVPYVYAFRYVSVRKVLGYEVMIESEDGTFLAKHKIPLKKRERVIDPQHYAGIRSGKTTNASALGETFVQKFSQGQAYLKGLKSISPAHWQRIVVRIVRLLDLYSSSQIDQALSYGIMHTIYQFDVIYTYLTSHFDIGRESVVAQGFQLPPIDLSDIKRDLNDYNKLVDLPVNKSNQVGGR